MIKDPIAPVAEFHEQLLRLSAAGLAFDLGLESTELETAIMRVEAALRLRVGLHQSLGEAIASASELTSRHRAALLTWLDTDEPTAVLDSLTQAAQSRRRLNRQIGVSLIQPFILLVLTIVAFGLLYNITIPRLESTYRQLAIQPSGLLAYLLRMRDAMPLVIVAGAAMFFAVIYVVIFRRATVSRWCWLPGGRRFLDAQRYAAFAEQVATMLDRGVPIDRSLELADAELVQSLRTNPDVAPPLLRWALFTDVGAEPLQNVYRFVANSYYQIAEQRSLGIRLILPVVLLSLFGGALVFAYGVSVFVPMIDLLIAISAPGGTTR